MPSIQHSFPLRCSCASYCFTLSYELYLSSFLVCWSFPSPLLQVPLHPGPMFTKFCWSCFPLMRRTSAWTMVRLSAAYAFDHSWKWDIPTPCRRCSCFQWCFVSIAYSLLGPLMFLLTTSFLFLSGSQLLRFCCPLSPVTSLPSGLWLPWKLPPQRILVGLVLWLAVESDRCNWWWDS